MTIFLPCLIITFPKSSILGSPSGESQGGGEGRYSAGRVARTWVSTSVFVGVRLCTAGARMNTALNGFEGLDKTGISRAASNDSSWAKKKTNSSSLKLPPYTF